MLTLIPYPGRLSRLLFPLSTKLRVHTRGEDLEPRCGYANHPCGVNQAAYDSAGGPPDSNVVPLTSDPSTTGTSSPGISVSSRPMRVNTFPDLPPNVMLREYLRSSHSFWECAHIAFVAPPLPVKQHTQPSTICRSPETLLPKSLSRRSFRKVPMHPERGRSNSTYRQPISQNTVHFKRRHAEPIDPPINQPVSAPHRSLCGIAESSASRTNYNRHEGIGEVPMDKDDSSESSSEDMDSDDSESSHIVVPSSSPLRRSFGIFCTGRGRGAFNSPSQVKSLRPRISSEKVQLGLKRELEEGTVDTDHGRGGDY